jgi:hypothetical protein
VIFSGVCPRAAPTRKLLLNFLDDGALLFVQRPAQHIRPSRWQAGKGLADLQDVFLVNHQAERVAQNRFQRRMRIGDRFQPLIAPGERQLLAFVGRARAG